MSAAHWQPLWEYRDDAGALQGPFALADMQAWYAQGHFAPTIQVRRHADAAAAAKEDASVFGDIALCAAISGGAAAAGAAPPGHAPLPPPPPDGDASRKRRHGELEAGYGSAVAHDTGRGRGASASFGGPGGSLRTIRLPFADSERVLLLHEDLNAGPGDPLAGCNPFSIRFQWAHLPSNPLPCDPSPSPSPSLCLASPSPSPSLCLAHRA